MDISRVPTYLITFCCYASWLPGQEGAVDREHNVFGGRFAEPNTAFVARARSLMTQSPYVLDASRRGVVLEGLCELSKRRGWTLHASHVRTSHVHAVINALRPPELVLNAMKSYASRHLNLAGFDTPDRRRWERHGSTRYLWTHEAIVAAIKYVVYEQGEAMTVFEQQCR
jgi:REP element-mobilizing transposase RayT